MWTERKNSPCFHYNAQLCNSWKHTGQACIRISRYCNVKFIESDSKANQIKAAINSRYSKSVLLHTSTINLYIVSSCNTIVFLKLKELKNSKSHVLLLFARNLIIIEHKLYCMTMIKKVRSEKCITRWNPFICDGKWTFLEWMVLRCDGGKRWEYVPNKIYRFIRFNDFTNKPTTKTQHFLSFQSQCQPSQPLFSFFIHPNQTKYRAPCKMSRK